MKKGIIISLMLITSCITVLSFTSKEKQPPSFKQDMEDFSALLQLKAAEFCTSRNYQDSASAALDAKNAADAMALKWDVQEEMKNANVLWPSQTICILACAADYFQCTPPENTVPPYPGGWCLYYYVMCHNNCSR